ncbi:MAG TPA: hypothetical protein VMM78_15860, partial [Thermomicrobiales bacterium]|nr:hypothetical protein [Thermomicrobiales bacterium]
VIDRQHCTITTWWGLLVPFYRSRHPVSQAHWVVISREQRSVGKGGRYEVFPVRLEGANTKAITIRTAVDHDTARRLAEDVAKFAHLGIRDRSSKRKAGTLDQPVQRSVRRAGRSMRPPAQPRAARAIFTYRGTRAPSTIEIPPIGHDAREVRRIIVLGCFMAFVLELMVYGESDVPIGVVGLFGFLLVPVILLPLLIRSAILREHVTVSPDDLVVTTRDLLGTRTTRMTSGEIEEVEVVRGKYGMYGGFAVIGGGRDRVAIRSDHGSIELGATLSKRAELTWLRDVLVHILTSSEDQNADNSANG